MNRSVGLKTQNNEGFIMRKLNQKLLEMDVWLRNAVTHDFMLSRDDVSDTDKKHFEFMSNQTLSYFEDAMNEAIKLI